jgi:hypothetical protein
MNLKVNLRQKNNLKSVQNQTIMNEDNNNDLINVNYNDYIQNKT